jgi:hypothetical protein
MLQKADAVRIDGGPLLDDWDISPIEGISDIEIARFSWEDASEECYVSLTEDSFNNGVWLKDGTFQCRDSEGILYKIEMFSLVKMNCQSL